MTISGTTIQTSGSLGNGATVQFSFSFNLDPDGYGSTSAAEQVQVIKETVSTGAEEILTLTTDYSVSVNADQSATPGGSVTLVSAPSSSYRIWIRLNPEFTQQTSLINQGAFLAAVVMGQMDQHTRQILALRDRINKAPRVGVQAGTSFDGEIAGDLTAGYVPIVNGDLDGWTLGTPAAGATVSAAMAPVVASATIDAAMELLDQGDFTATGATAARNLADRFSEVLWPEDFGAVGDGTTDDLTPLTNWLNAVMASASRRGFMRPKVYAVSGALPQINIPGVVLVGLGPKSSHDGGAAAGTVTTIKAITNSGFTMLTVAPTEGAGNQRLDGNKVLGIALDCNSLAAKGLLVKSVHHGEFDVFAAEATTSGVETDVVATLAEAESTQRNVFCVAGRQLLNTAPGLRLKGDASQNTSFNRFERVNIVHGDGSAAICEGADNNSWGDVSLFCAGAATNSMEWHGAAAAGQHVRAEKIDRFSSTKPAIAKGLASYAVPAVDIVIEYLDTENGTPEPTVEAGASVRWGTAPSPNPQAPGYNLVINGDFALNQLAPATNADKTAGFDGGVVLTQTDTIALSSQSSPGVNQAQCLRMTQSQAVAQRMGYMFVVPSEDTVPLRGKGVALAALIRLSASADVRVAILEWTGTADAVAGDIVADWTSATYTTAGFFESTTKNVLAVMETAATAATWRELSGLLSTGGLTATVGASANNLIVFIWTEGTVAQNVTLDIGRVRFIAGHMPDGNFPAETRAETIERCQRQVFKTYNLSTAPGTSTAVGARNANSQGNAQASRWWTPFRTRMRATPTATVYSQTGASGNVRDVSVGADIAASTTGAGETGVTVFPTANTTAINIITFHIVATAYLWT